MSRTKILIITFFVLATVAIVAEIFYYNNFVKGNIPKNENANTSEETPVSENSQPEVASAATNTNTQAEAATKNDTQESNAEPSEQKVVPPMDNFNGRISLNPFGNEPSKMKLSVSEYTDLSCSGGKNYAGYHTGNDFEVTPQERLESVSVFSIADGVVRQASTVNGYGGLVVIEYQINGKTYTAYYGHVDIKTVSVKAGQKVKVEQEIAELAPACSAANGNTRKHLHFGIHRGRSIVVAGYVNTKAELSNWVDAREIIK